MDKRWETHVLSYTIVSGSYIASFCGGGVGGGNKGGENKRYDDDENHVGKEEEEYEE